MSKIQVIVLFGGQSTEHEISCKSASYIVNNLDRQKYEVKLVGISKSGKWIEQALPADTMNRPLEVIDTQNTFRIDNIREQSQKTVFFPILHGTKGEDGCTQGLLELSSAAYVGPDVLGSASAMDKITAKILVKNANVPVVPWVDFRLYEWNQSPDLIIKEIEDKLSYPVFVKAASLGSSVGVYKAENSKVLYNSIEKAFHFDDRLLIEQGVDAREIEFAALGGYNPDISEAGEVVIKSDFYSYKSKYEDPEATEVVVPADLPKEISIKGKLLAAKAFKALNLYGLSRIDFFLDKNTSELIFNEANTLPGFTEISQYPKLCEQAGYSATALLDKLVTLALERQAQKMQLNRSFK